MAPDRVTAARVEYRHPVDVVAVLAGRPAQAAPQLMASLFAVCREAQSAAAALACGAALGEELPPDRRRQILLELGREHSRRLLLDWPAALGRAPRLPECRALLTALDGVARNPGDEALAGLERALMEVIGPELPGAGGPVPAGGLLAAVAEADRAGITPPVPGAGGRLEASRLSELLATDARGPAAEAGAVSRRAGDARVAECIHRGAGVAARLLARLVELVDLPAWLRGGAPVWGVERPAAGVGLAWVETARGLLIHRAEVDDGRIRGYRLLAPTDWNFGPGERLSGALAGMAATDADTARRWTELAVLALDPCVPATVTVE